MDQTTANRKLDDVNEGKLSTSQFNTAATIVVAPFHLYSYNWIDAMQTRATHVVAGVDVLLQEEHNTRTKVLSQLSKVKRNIIAPYVSVVLTLGCA